MRQHVAASDQRVRKSSGEPRGKRPSSEVIMESAAADLNAIAQELSQGDAGQPEVKTVAGRSRPPSGKSLASSKRSNSAIGFNKTYTPRCDTPDQQAPPTSSSSSAAGSGGTAKTKFLSSGAGGGGSKSNRPTSAREYYQHRRTDSLGGGGSLEPPNLETHLERSHSEARFDVQGSNAAHGIIQRKSSGGSGRSSAPSSGRSTPVHRSTSSTRLGKDATDGGVVSTAAGKIGAGLPPRTPYKYV